MLFIVVFREIKNIRWKLVRKGILKLIFGFIIVKDKFGFNWSLKFYYVM